MPPTQTDEGLVAAREIRKLYPEMGVLVLSEHIEPRYATQLLEEYPERTGYLLKGRVSDVAVLADAVHRIERGECVVDPTIVSRLMNRRRRGGAIGALTDDERELLALVAEGHSNESIADRFGTDAVAIERDITGVFGKLEIETPPNDVRRALSVLASIRS
jgi:DNA-binding NarL/FixJ family response regulator